MKPQLVASLLLALPACSGEITSGGGGDGGVPPGADAGTGAASPDARFCAQVKVELTRTIPDVVLLLDQSGSMTAGFGPTNRWEAMYDTLMNPASGVVKRLEDEVRFGLALYTSNGGNAGGTCPVLTEVPPALANHAAIDAVFGPASPQGDTPTGESIVAVATALAASASTNPKIIVLATDGEPDTCEDPNGNGRSESVMSAESAYALGIRTYVISVGDDVGATHLQDVANAGAGLPVGGAVNEPYYQALQPDQLVAAFETIIGGVQSCTFTLDGMVDDQYAADGSVTIDGVPLTYGTDWTITGGNTLEILGAACEGLKDGAMHTVEAFFTCDAIIG